MTTAPPDGPGDGATQRTDAEVEAVLTHRSGQQVPPHLEREVLAVVHLRESLVEAAPTPSAELALLLREGSRTRARSSRLFGAAGWFVGLGMGAQVGLASAAAAAGIVAAGTAHVLPAPVQDAYDSLVATLQPEEEDRGTDAPSQVGTGAGVATGTSTTDLPPRATPPDDEPDRDGVDARDDEGPGTPGTPGSPGPGSGPAGHGAGALPSGGPSTLGPAAAGGGSSAHGEAHSPPDTDDDQDAAEEAADAAEDAADAAEDQAEDAEDEAEDAKDEAEDAEDEAEDAEDEAEDEEREDDGE